MRLSGPLESAALLTVLPVPRGAAGSTRGVLPWAPLVGLVLGGIVLYGGTNTDLSSAGAAVIAAGIVAAGAGLIFAPRLAATREALDEAPAVQRTALLMNRIGGLTHPEIAERLGVSASMVSKYIMAVMDRIIMRLSDAID